VPADGRFIGVGRHAAGTGREKIDEQAAKEQAIVHDK
jgi:hypothetical protein